MLCTVQDEDDETYLKKFDNVVVGATAEDGTTIDASESVYDDEGEDYSDEEDSDEYSEDEEDESYGGYEDCDEDGESTRTSAAEFRNDTSSGFSDSEEYRPADAGDSDGNGKCKEGNDARSRVQNITVSGTAKENQ